MILFLEHIPTITAGINYNINNLLVSEDLLREKGVALEYIRRGGDFTAHEAGQLVIYPHIDLKLRRMSLNAMVRSFSDSIQRAIQETWGIQTFWNTEAPGLYVKTEMGAKKLVSIGMYFKGFFSSFGAAMNVSNDLSVFQLIHPCGVSWKDITTLEKLEGDINREKEFIYSFTDRFLSKLNSL